MLLKMMNGLNLEEKTCALVENWIVAEENNLKYIIQQIFIINLMTSTEE